MELNLIAYVNNNICFNKKAIEISLQQEGNESIRDSLIAIINNEHEFTKKRQEYIDDLVKDDDSVGMGADIFSSMANTDYQMEAMQFLEPLVGKDDLVYEIILSAALGKKSNIGNVANAAIQILARNDDKRKEQILEIAKNPKKEDKERATAYKILLLHKLATDKVSLELFCNLTKDRSIIDFYEQQGELSPGAKHEYKMIKKYDYLRKGKDLSDDEIKETAVQKSQNQFCLEAFEILGYVKNKDFLKQLGESQHIRYKLVNSLSNLIETTPSYHVDKYCSLIKNLPHFDDPFLLNMAYDTLKRVITSDAYMDQDWVINTLVWLYQKINNNE